MRLNTHQLVLVGRDSGEYGLWVDERLILLHLEVGDGRRNTPFVPLYQVYPWLVFVHRVQDQLAETDLSVSGDRTRIRFKKENPP